MEIRAIVVEEGVREIEIPPQVWHITDDVFEGCTSLRRIILHSEVIDSLCWVPEGVELITKE